MLGGRTISNTDFDVEAGFVVVVAPVNRLLAYDLTVGNDDGDVVAGFNETGPGADLAYPSYQAVDLDHVAYLDGTFKEQDDAAEEVIESLLQADEVESRVL